MDLKSTKVTDDRLLDKAKYSFDENEVFVNNREYLICSFKDKDEVKKVGGRWDIYEKKWYIGDGKDRGLFKKWLPSEDTNSEEEG